LVGCSPLDSVPTSPQAHLPDTEEGVDTDATPARDTADSDAAGVPEPLDPFDCAAQPAPPLASHPVPAARGTHGLVFDSRGSLSGNADGVLYRVNAAGRQTIVATGLGTLHQLDRLPDGDLVAASASLQALLRISRRGSVSPLVELDNVYGVRVGPDGLVYAANGRALWRVDPVTGDTLPWITSEDDFFPKVFDWSHDYRHVYVGTVSSGGGIWVVELDEHLEPTGPPRPHARDVGISWHDALAGDICGNLYVSEAFSRALYKVTPDGVVTRLLQDDLGYPHGLAWGPGTHGWGGVHLYLSQPYNGGTVAELDVGVPARDWPGVVLNRP
jgi:hypothetical protein